MLVVASTLVGYAMADGEPLGLVRVCGLLLGTGSSQAELPRSTRSSSAISTR